MFSTTLLQVLLDFFFIQFFSLFFYVIKLQWNCFGIKSKATITYLVFHVSFMFPSTSTLPKTFRRDSTAPSRCWLERVTAPQRTSGALPAWWDTLSASDTSTHTLCHGLGGRRAHWGHVPSTSLIFALPSLHFLQPFQPLNSFLTYYNVSFWATSKSI